MTEDVVDAYVYARRTLNLGDRCVIGGASAGTTVAALAALELLKRRREARSAATSRTGGGGEDVGVPKAFLSVYGLLDTLSYLYQERRAPLSPNPTYLVSTDSQLAEIYANPNPREASVQNPWDTELPPHVPLQEIRDHLGLPEYTPSDVELRRVDLYSYAAAHGNLIESVCRMNEYKTEEEFVDRVKQDSPQHLLDLHGEFMPTFLMHGLADDVVPASHSESFAQSLRSRGVPTEEVYIEGAGHVYDFGFEKAGDKGWDESVVPCLDFLGRHV